MTHKGLMIFCFSSMMFLAASSGLQGLPSAYLMAHVHSCFSCDPPVQSTQLSFSSSMMRKQSPGPLADCTSATFLMATAPTTVMSSLSCVKYRFRPLKRN